MHTEHLNNVRPGVVAFGWFVSAAVTSMIVIALALSLAALPVAAQPAGTLLVGLVAEPVNLDPAQARNALD